MTPEELELLASSSRIAAGSGLIGVIIGAVGSWFTAASVSNIEASRRREEINFERLEELVAACLEMETWIETVLERDSDLNFKASALGAPCRRVQSIAYLHFPSLAKLADGLAEEAETLKLFVGTSSGVTPKNDKEIAAMWGNFESTRKRLIKAAVKLAR